MQINSTIIIPADYTTATQNVKTTDKAETTSDVKFDTSKPFDINTFTFDDYKNSNGNVNLTQWIEKSDLPNENEVLAKVNGFVGTAFYSDDDTLNEVLFDKLDKSYENGENWADFISTTLLPLADMNSSFEPSTLKEIKNVPTRMESYLKNSAHVFDAEDVLSNMQGFPDFYDNAGEFFKSIMGDVSATYVAFDEIVAEYSKRKDEQNATLDAYIRNNKKNTVLI